MMAICQLVNKQKRLDVFLDTMVLPSQDAWSGDLLYCA